MRKAKLRITGIVIIPLLLSFSTNHINAQSSFDEKEGCLNVVNTTVTKGTGEYGDDTFSMNYQHERFISEQWSIGAGIGYNYHHQYRLAIVPVFVSSTFFFLTSSLKKHVFYNWLINTILYLCVI